MLSAGLELMRILVFMLDQDNRLLRGVVGAVYIVERRGVTAEVGGEVVLALGSLIGLASSGSVVVGTLGQTFPWLASSLLGLEG